MENQIYLNMLISLIIAVSISYFYLRKINTKFFIYSITIFLISFTILFYLGPKNNVESFNNSTGKNLQVDVGENTGTTSVVKKSEEIDNVLSQDEYVFTSIISIQNNQNNWRNIYHYGNNDRERMPSLYIFYKNPWRMNFRFRTNKNWNDGLKFYIPTALREYNKKLKIQVKVSGKKRLYFGNETKDVGEGKIKIEAYVNDKLVGQKESNADYLEIYLNRKLYIKSPWFSRDDYIVHSLVINGGSDISVDALDSKPTNLSNNKVNIQEVGSDGKRASLLNSLSSQLLEETKQQEEVLNLLKDPVSIISKNPNLTNVQEEVTTNIQEEVTTNIQEEVTPNIQDELAYTFEENYATVNNEEMSEELNKEQESNQEEILNQQEEYIRSVVDEEIIEEEDNNDELKKKFAKKKILSPQTNKLGGLIQGNNNQVNPGIGIGVSPVNIYINGDKTSVDKFKNNKGNSNNSQNMNCDSNDDNYYKKASRIYNNSDWVYDKPQWCNNDSNDEKYNYDKNDYLLPTDSMKNNINKIPQTLNEAVNSKKPKNKSEPCPLDVNKPWSIYKTGDDKENNELIPEGFNL